MSAVEYFSHRSRKRTGNLLKGWDNLQTLRTHNGEFETTRQRRIDVFLLSFDSYGTVYGTEFDAFF